MNGIHWRIQTGGQTKDIDSFLVFVSKDRRCVTHSAAQISVLRQYPAESGARLRSLRYSLKQRERCQSTDDKWTVQYITHCVAILLFLPPFSLSLSLSLGFLLLIEIKWKGTREGKRGEPRQKPNQLLRRLESCFYASR